MREMEKQRMRDDLALRPEERLSVNYKHEQHVATFQPNGGVTIIWDLYGDEGYERVPGTNYYFLFHQMSTCTPEIVIPSSVINCIVARRAGEMKRNVAS